MKMSFISGACAFVFATLSVIQSSQAGTILAENSWWRDVMVSRIQAAHFLQQATFGPSPGEVFRLGREIQSRGRDRALNAWIDEQFAIPNQELEERALYIQDFLDIPNGEPGDIFPRDSAFDGIHQLRNYAMWEGFLDRPDQLRQRTAYALSQIFVTNTRSDAVNGRWHAWRGPAYFYNVLLENSFENFSDLLLDVTYSPTMGHFLDHAKNVKGRPGDPSRGIPHRFPDENYAREFLQLFTIGTFALNDDGTFKLDSNGNRIENYSNETIRNFARIFTGFTYRLRPHEVGRGYTFFSRPVNNLYLPMEMFDEQHDQESKTLLNGFTTPAGAGGEQDVRLAVQNASEHSSCPPYIARLLIQRFTTSNPSTQYVSDVSAAFRGRNGTPRGDMKEVLRAILMHPEARDSLNIRVRSRSAGGFRIDTEIIDPHHGRMQEPLLNFTSLLRAFNARPRSASRDNANVFELDHDVRTFPLSAASVFNFYLPDNQPNGPISDAELVSPEFTIFSASGFNGDSNRVWEIFRTYSTEEANSSIRVFRRKGGLRLDTAWAFERINANWGLKNFVMDTADIVLCAGTMHDDLKNHLRTRVVDDNSIELTRKMRVLFTTLYDSPDMQIKN